MSVAHFTALIADHFVVLIRKTLVLIEANAENRMHFDDCDILVPKLHPLRVTRKFWISHRRDSLVNLGYRDIGDTRKEDQRAHEDRHELAVEH